MTTYVVLNDALMVVVQMLSRCGYGGASLDLISAEAGYSKGAVYSNFDVSEQVLAKLTA